MGPKTRRFRLYAALHEDIAAGFVWLSIEGLPARSIVKISHEREGGVRSTWCEALQFDENFLRVYNKPGVGRRQIESGEESLHASMVLNRWYRSKLGMPRALETGEDYALTVTPANGWIGRVRAALHNPQLAIRLATWLGLLGLALGIFGLFLALVPLYRSRTEMVRSESSKPIAVSVESLLKLRESYGDLLGKPREAAVERFGPSVEMEGGVLTWEGSARTGNRSVMLFLRGEGATQRIRGVKLFAGASESLDILEILKRAPMFNFSTGVYEDSVTNHLTVKTKDGRSGFQFDVSDRGVFFKSMLFVDTP